jgi:hypothetical protein
MPRGGNRDGAGRRKGSKGSKGKRSVDSLTNMMQRRNAVRLLGRKMVNILPF